MYWIFFFFEELEVFLSYRTVKLRKRREKITLRAYFTTDVKFTVTTLLLYSYLVGANWKQLVSSKTVWTNTSRLSSHDFRTRILVSHDTGPRLRVTGPTAATFTSAKCLINSKTTSSRSSARETTAGAVKQPRVNVYYRGGK